MPVPGLTVVPWGSMSLGEILGIISGVLLTLTSCALAAYYRWVFGVWMVAVECLGFG